MEDRRLPVPRNLHLSICFLALLMTGIHWSATGQNVRVSTSTDSVTVGDRFHLHIAADYPDGTRAILPDFNQADTSLGDLTVIKQVGFPERSATPIGHTDSVTYEVATFALDSARVPPINVRFARETDTLRARSEPFAVEVGSLVPEDAEDIRGLTPLATFPRPLWPWILGGGLALIMAAALLYLFLKRSEEEEQKEVEQTPQLPPYAEAMTRLEELETTDLEAAETPKPFYVELSDLLRTYVARTTNIPARELTTPELVDILHRRDGELARIYSAPRIERIDVILRLADLVKFADRQPKPDDSRSALGATRRTIESLEEKQRELEEKQHEREETEKAREEENS